MLTAKMDDLIGYITWCTHKNSMSECKEETLYGKIVTTI